MTAMRSGGSPNSRAAASKKAGLGLPARVAVLPEAYSRAATKGPASRLRPPVRVPGAVALDGQQLGAVHQVAKGAVEDLERPPLGEVSDHDVLRRPVVDLHPLELSPGLPGEQEPHPLHAAGPQPPRSRGRSGKDLLGTGLDAQGDEPLGERGSRHASRVRREAEGDAGSAQRLDRGNGALDRPALLVHGPVEINEAALDAVD